MRLLPAHSLHRRQRAQYGDRDKYAGYRKFLWDESRHPQRAVLRDEHVARQWFDSLTIQSMGSW